MKSSMYLISTILTVSVFFFQGTAQVSVNITGSLADPSSMLDVTSSSRGLLLPRMSKASRNGIILPAKGLIVYDSTFKSFWFYNGAAWGEIQYERLWNRNPLLFETCLTNIADKVGIGTASPLYNLHLVNLNMINSNPPLMVEQQGTGDASMAFYLNPQRSFSVGYDNNYNYFKISDTTVHTGMSYNDHHTMMAFSNANRGVVHMNHQSRARAFMHGANNPPIGFGQIIPANVWTPINFDAVSFDEQNEFSLSIGPNAGFFSPREEGYYQVNARTEFTSDPPDSSPSWVAIAIYVNGIPRAYGNSLCIWDTDIPADRIVGNNGPNVSDVLHLVPGDVVTIWAFQNFNGSSGMCVGGSDKTYFSIHKVS